MILQYPVDRLISKCKKGRVGDSIRPRNIMIIIFILFILTVINCNHNTVPSTSFISGMYYNVKKIDGLIYCATARGLEIFCLKDNHIKLLSKYATDGVARAVDISG